MTDLSLIPEAAWIEAQRRADVVLSLSEVDFSDLPKWTSTPRRQALGRPEQLTRHPE